MELEKEMNLYAASENPVRSFSAKKKKHNVLTRQKIIVTFFLIIFTGIGILLTPVFNVQRITVSGNSYISTDKILEASEIKTDKNIFLFRKSEAEKRIGDLSFTDEVCVSRIFPSEVVIEIKECEPIAQVACGQSLYLVIDKNGKILDTAGELEKYSVPVISNMKFNEFEVGKMLDFENSGGLKKTLELLRELKQNDMMESVTSVYADGSNIHAVLNKNIDCNFGYEDNLSYRVKFVKECMQKIPDGQGGKISFVDDYKAVFTKEEEVKDDENRL